MKFGNYKLANKWPRIAVIFSLFSLAPKVASAGLTDILLMPYWSFVISPMGYVLQLEMVLLKIVASYNSFTKEAGVELGWVVLRDFSNMFFILILLVISFATILRISSYGYQQLLKRTILVAIFINFSKTIVGFLIDIVQVVMLTFIASISEIITGGIAVAIGIDKLTTLNSATMRSVGPTDKVIGVVLASVFLAILIVIIGVMIMMLMMRIVALWVAIVLAPLAFLASIFPATKSFYSRWVKELGANLVSGPMLAFFLWLTFSIVGGGNAYSSFGTEGSEGLVDQPTEFLGLNNMVNYVIAIALLLMGLKMASASGAAGASMASKGMGKIEGAAAKARSGARYLADRYPRAAATRAAGGLARRMQNEDGTLKDFKIAKKMPLVGGKNLSRMAGLGGLTERGLMKVRGGASRMEERYKGDTDGILPEHRIGWHTSKSRWVGKGDEKDGVKPSVLGKVQGFISKVSGDKAAKAAANQERLIKGKRLQNPEEATQIFREMGGMEKEKKQTQGKYGTFEDFDGIEGSGIAEASELIEEKGAVAFIKGLGARVDDNGNSITTSGNVNAIKALSRHPDVVGPEAAKALASGDKAMKATYGPAVKIASDDEMVEHMANPRAIIATEKNPHTGLNEMSEDNKDAIPIEGMDELVKLFTMGTGFYPGDVADQFNELVGKMEAELRDGEVNFSDEAIQVLPQGPRENDDDYKERKNETEAAWIVNTNEFKEKENKWKEDNAQNDGESDDDYNDRWSGSEVGLAAGKEVATRRRQLKQVWLDEEIDPEIARIKAEEPEETHHRKIQQVLESPLKQFGVDVSPKQIEQMLEFSTRLGPKPEVEAVTNEEVQERLQTKKGGDVSEEAITARVKEKGLGYGDALNPAVARNMAKKELEAEGVDESDVRAELEAEKRAKHETEVAEYDDQKRTEAANIRRDLDNVEAGPEGKRITAITKEITKIEASPDNGTPEALKKIAQLTAEANTMQRIQYKRRKAAMGMATENNKNMFAGSLLKHATDGADYSRLEEMNVNKSSDKDLFMELAKVATQGQQRQLLEAGNGNQIKLFAETVANSGKKPSKVVTDNLAPNAKLEVFRKVYVIKEVQGGANLFVATADAKRKSVDTLGKEVK